MSYSYDVSAIYGFPAGNVEVSIPTKLGERAPHLHDWLKGQPEWQAATKLGIDIHFLGQPNGGNSVPFIGLEIADARDCTRVFKPFAWFDPTDVPNGVTGALQNLHDLLFPNQKGVIGHYVCGAVT